MSYQDDTFLVPLHLRETSFLSKHQVEALQLLSLDSVAEKTRDYLSTRRRVFDNAHEVIETFAHLTPIAAGEYGVVARGCLRDPDAPKKRKAATCKRIEVGEDPNVVMPLIVKFAWQMPAPAMAADTSATWALTHDYQWEGSSNAMREALIGRLLNLLVTKKACANFSTLYSVLEIKKPPPTMLDTFRDIGRHKDYLSLMQKKRGPYFTTAPKPIGASMLVICMDENAMDLEKFCKSVLKKHPRAVDILESMFCQVAAALYTADKHYGFRHNDLHDKNIMVASTNEMYYMYKVSGKLFAVPTFGLSWKIVDYGMSTADKVFGRLDTAGIHAFGSSSIEWGLSQDCNPRHATELYDLSRLCNMLQYTLTGTKTRRWLRASVDAMLERISRKHDDLHVRTVWREIQRRRKAALDLSDRRREAEYKSILRFTARATKSHGLLKEAFYNLANPFEVRPAPKGVALFDADAPIDVSERSFEGHVLVSEAEAKPPAAA